MPASAPVSPSSGSEPSATTTSSAGAAWNGGDDAVGRKRLAFSPCIVSEPLVVVLGWAPGHDYHEIA